MVLVVVLEESPLEGWAVAACNQFMVFQNFILIVKLWEEMSYCGTHLYIPDQLFYGGGMLHKLSMMVKMKFSKYRQKVGFNIYQSRLGSIEFHLNTNKYYSWIIRLDFGIERLVVKTPFQADVSSKNWSIFIRRLFISNRVISKFKQQILLLYLKKNESYNSISK